MFRPLLAALCCLIFPPLLLGGTVVMRDGRTYEGAVRLAGGQVVVKPASGTEIKLVFADVASATFKEEERPARKPDPSEKVQRPAARPKTEKLEGLLAEYYAKPDLTDLKVKRIDRKVEFYWWDKPPDPTVPKQFSARWTGQIEPKYSETYTFELNVCGGVQLWIDGRIVVDRPTAKPGVYTGAIDLKTGRKYDLKLEFRGHTQGGHAHLLWSSAHQPKENVASRRLSPPAGVVVPAIVIASPADRFISEGPTVELEADTAPAGTIAKVEYYDEDKAIGAADKAPWRFAWKNAPMGPHRLRAKASDQNGLSAACEPILVTVTGDGGGTLGGKWREIAIGPNQPPNQPSGTARCEGGRYALASRGTDFAGEDDAFHCVFQPLRGDGTVVARIAEFSGGAGAAAGIFIRESMSSPRPRMAYLGVGEKDLLTFTRREWEGNQRSGSEEKLPVPCWLKLVRFDKLVKASASADGQKWQILGERKVEMGHDVYVGVAVAGKEPAKAVFEELSAAPLVLPMASTAHGVMLVSGSVIGGDITAADDTSVHINASSGPLSIPTNSVARLLFQAVPEDRLAGLPPGRRGVILKNGEFLAGSVKVKDGWPFVNSVLFGIRRVDPWNDALAAILRDVQPATGKYIIRCANKSLIQAKSVTPDSDRLKVVEQTDLAVTLGAAEILEIRSQ